ncbi:MAG TPA: OmpH family outer membrane protein [Bacteroidales bacterium]|nr:OmpH family outer membrane protein [Bacteroidales bacterium]HPS16111.1 OmpH family outer membrane protein [Bacteroidales bacterium]
MEENVLNTENTLAKSNDNCKTNCCSKLTFYFSIISLLGVIVLFILFFFGKKDDISTRVMDIKNKTVSVGYVNSDTIMENYLLVKNMKDSLKVKQDIAEKSLLAKQTAFKSSVLAYQNKMKANLLSIDEATKTEKILSQQQEDLYTLNDEMTSQLAAEELKINNMLQDSIINFLNRYNKKYQFDYILGFARGGGILYANDSLNITKEILDGLNREYKTEKK